MWILIYQFSELAAKYGDSNKRDREFDLLMSEGADLQRTHNDIVALQGYWYLFGMVNKHDLGRAMAFVKSQYGSTKSKTEMFIRSIEKRLHISRTRKPLASC